MSRRHSISCGGRSAKTMLIHVIMASLGGQKLKLSD